MNNLPSASSDEKRHIMVSSTMSASEIIEILAERNCRNITSGLDLVRCTRAPISCGGFGDVFKGMLKDQTEVAIKCPRLYVQQDDARGHKTLKHAARELYIWSRLKHENILELLGLAEYQDRMAMISPWMANGTLLEYIDKNPEVDRYPLLVQTTRGVAYLHECDSIHGDLKSANIFVAKSGVVKIADFGFTTLKAQTLGFTASTMNPAISARWTAPEVLRGEVLRSKEADVYSLGMVFLEIVTGCIPFDDIAQDMSVIFVACSGRKPTRPTKFASFSAVQADLLWSLFEGTWVSEPQKRLDLSTIQDRLHTIEKHSTQLPVESVSQYAGRSVPDEWIENRQQLRPEWDSNGLLGQREHQLILSEQNFGQDDRRLKEDSERVRLDKAGKQTWPAYGQHQIHDSQTQLAYGQPQAEEDSHPRSQGYRFAEQGQQLPIADQRQARPQGALPSSYLQPPYPWNGTSRYPRQGACEWAEYYLSGGDDPSGLVYFTGPDGNVLTSLPPIPPFPWNGTVQYPVPGACEWAEYYLAGGDDPSGLVYFTGPDGRTLTSIPRDEIVQ